MYLLATSLWDKLEKMDQWLFVKINSDYTNSFFDNLMPYLRTANIWIPLYLFLAVFVLLNFRSKGGWWILFFVVTVALTDMIGNNVFKHNIMRLRPCNDPDFFMHVRLLVDHCSSGFSFVSNHAANHFGLGVFFFLTMRPVIKKWAFIGLIWAAAIAYSQVYVGVHYPLDILGGALLGLIFGGLTGSLFNKRFGFAIFDNQPTIST